MKKVSVLDENQPQRDIELSELVGISVDRIKDLKIAIPATMRLYMSNVEEPETKEEIESLYKHYKYCNFIGYLRTLMHTSIHRRELDLISLLRTTHNKKCLDFGSGSGTHAIALAENGCDVTLLDIDGPLLEFTKRRMQKRGHEFKVFTSDELLPSNEFDIVICTDVLEHVFDPIHELKRIYKSMKVGGILHLSVPSKPNRMKAHFENAINIWSEQGRIFVKQHFVKLQKKTIYKKIEVVEE